MKTRTYNVIVLASVRAPGLADTRRAPYRSFRYRALEPADALAEYYRQFPEGREPIHIEEI